MSAKLWFKGARPMTLPVAVSSVVVGACVAWPIIEGLGVCPAVSPTPAYCAANAQRAALLGSRFWPVLLLCLAVAVLLQVSANYANDYFDGIRGVDEGRGTEGGTAAGADQDANQDARKHDPKPMRLTASGKVAPRNVLFAAIGCAVAACVLGLIAVVWTGAWWLLAVGVVCVLAAWGYTGGKHPYGYAGLGELGVFVCFGLAAVLGTQYALTGALSVFGIICAVCAGLFDCVVLMVNNLRDVESDERHGKRTLAVRLGARRARVVMNVVIVLAWLIAIYVGMVLWIPWGGVLMASGIGVPARLVSGLAKGGYRGALADSVYQTVLFALVVVVALMM